MQYIDVTGKTEDEAIAKALAQLGLERDDVSVEVLERAKKGFLGFGSSDALVRVSYGAPDEEAVPEEKPEPPERKAAEKPAPRQAPAETAETAEKAVQEPVKKTEPAAETAGPVPEKTEEPESEPAAEKPEADERTDGSSDEEEKAAKEPGEGRSRRQRQRRRNRRRNRENAGAAAPEDDTRPASEAAPETEQGAEQETVPAEELEPLDPDVEVDDEKAQAIRTFLTGLLEHMDCEAEIHIFLPEKGRYKVILEGSKMGALIGHRGETLDAIQQLTGYCVNRGGGPRVRVQLDAEGYREKREKSLENLARKVATKVLHSHRNMTLEPMNAYERHVIHAALQDFDGVSTYSVGTDPNRRVVVAYGNMRADPDR